MILKCFSHLNCEDLILVITRFFHAYGINKNFQLDTLTEDLTILLNRIQVGEEWFLKSLLILFFQNPEFVLIQVYTESVKNANYSKCLRQFYEDTKIIVEVDSLALRTFESVLNANRPEENNIGNYIELINTLIDVNVLTLDKLLFLILKPFIEKLHQSSNYELLFYSLTLLNSSLVGKNLILDRTKYNISDILSLLLEILNANRINFFGFSKIKQNINDEVVKFLINYVEETRKNNYIQNGTLQSNHFLNKFYVDSLSTNNQLSFFDFVYKNFDVNASGSNVAKFIKLMPVCTPQEISWLILGLKATMEHRKIVEFLTEAMVLMSQLTNSQSNAENKNTIFSAYRYCLHNYGILLKVVLKFLIYNIMQLIKIIFL